MVRLASVLAVMGCLLLVESAGALAASGQTLDPSRPHGQTYGQWAAGWWSWVLSQPVTTTAEQYCAKGVQPSGVLFPAPVFGLDTATLSCTVPAGTALFSPAANTVYCAYSTDPPDQQTEEYIRAQVAHVRTHAHDLLIEVDGRAQPLTYSESPLFNVVLPENNLFDLPAGFLVGPCADAGYYRMIPPQSVGEHTIHVHGAIDAFSVDVSYHLTVAPR